MYRVKTMNPPRDEFLIDQLVLGTLKGSEYRRALLTLEANPERWRDCALAFLQEQAIAQELNDLATASVDWNCNAQSTIAGSSKPVASDLVAQTSMDSAANVNANATSWVPSSQHAVWHRWLSMAAVLLMSFGVGWMGSALYEQRGSMDHNTPHDLAVNPGSPAQSSSDIASSDIASATAPNLKLDAVTVDQVLPRRNDSKSEKFGNNFSFVGNSDMSLLPIDERVPPNLAKLEQEGRIRIDKTTALMPIEYGDMTVLVPVQQLQVTPITVSY